MADGISQLETAGCSTVAVDVYAHPAPTHRESTSTRGFFNKIPVELRIMIYEEAFTGSEMTLLSTPRGDPQAYPRGGRRSALFSSGHHHLLLTCRYIFNEAHTLYWTSTTVVNGDKDHRFSVRYLLSHLPQLAMPYIQNLRELLFSPKCDFGNVPGHQPPILNILVDEHRLREQLPNLKAYQPCEITHYPDSSQPIKNPRGWKRVFRDMYRHCPRIFYHSNGSLDALLRIRMVQKFPNLPAFPDRVAFFSRQTGRIWISEDPEISDTEGFARVLQDGSQDEIAQGVFLVWPE